MTGRLNGLHPWPNWMRRPEKAGVVEKSGSWFSYDGQRIGQGRENAKTYLREHPDVAQAIEQKVRENAGILAAVLDGTKEADDDAED